MKDVSNNCHGMLSNHKSKHKLSMNQYFRLLHESARLYLSCKAYQTPRYMTGLTIIQGTKYFSKRSRTEWRQTKANDIKFTSFDNKKAVVQHLGFGIKNKKSVKQANVYFILFCACISNTQTLVFENVSQIIFACVFFQCDCVFVFVF